MDNTIGSPEMVIAVAVWLSDMGATTWGGKGWDVTDPKERIEAARWFTKQIEELDSYIETRIALHEDVNGNKDESDVQ
jgi:hypothetical protein